MTKVNTPSIKDLAAELKKTKKELKEKTLLIDTLLESSQVGYWDWNVKEDKQFISQAIKQMFGYSPDELIGDSNLIREKIHPEDLDNINKVIEQHFKSKGETPFSTIMRYFHKDGSIVWVLTKGKVVEWDSEGKPLRMLGSNFNITNLMQTKNALELSELRFKSSFKHAGIGIALVAPDGKPFEVNEVFQQLLQYSEKELKSMTFAELTHPNDAEKDVETYKELLEGKIPNYNLDKRYIRKDKTSIWCNLSVALVRDQATNDPLYAIAMVQDITSQKRAEQELKKTNEQLENFAFLASHDLQEPLSTIKSFTNLIERRFGKELTEDGQTYLNFISSASARMSTLIKDLLDYSRIGTNRKLSTVDCNELLKNIQNDLSAQIHESDVTINVEPLPTLTAYHTELRLLFQNLISNAIKFNDPKRKLVISISVQSKLNEWIFEVKDNGIGIEEKYIDKIFKLFHRLHSKSEFEGTGIGLAHCQKIVELHEGSIWVESEFGVGSSFFFSIPN